jgi:hypothetical protein
MAGYVLREGSTEPVFGVNALDNWAFEVAMSMLCARAGIDAMTLGQPVRNTQTSGRRLYRTQENTVLYNGVKHFKARTLVSGNLPNKGHFNLERQSNYGNVPPLASDAFPADDPYLFKPEVTQRLLDKIRGITGQLGYDFTETPDGFIALRGRNNPTHWQTFTGVGPFATYTSETSTIALTSLNGPVFYRTSASSAWSRVFEGVFSRIDLYVGVGRIAGGANGGRLQVVVERKNAGGSFVAVSTTTVSTFVDIEEAYVYDNQIRTDGTNVAILKLGTFQPDYYRVTITPAGPETGEASCVYRLDGAAIFEYDPEATLFATTTGQRTLSTLGNILSIQNESIGKDQINHVVVVGSRKATVSDSVKFNSALNNPEQEFNVAVGTDPFSIYDPTAANFLGVKRMSVVFDEKVSDTDFALWLVRTLLYRYQNPARDGARFSHTALPILEPGDAVFVREERHLSVVHTLFVDDISETYTLTEATGNFDGQSFPAISSYQPKEDLDIDQYFVDPVTGKGLPAINVEIRYKNIYGRAVSNTSLSSVARTQGFFSRDKNSPRPMVMTALTTGITSLAISQIAIPETIFLSWYATGDASVPRGTDNIQLRSRALVNNPYRHFFRINENGWDSSGHPTVTFDFQEGDGTAGLYDTTYYQFPSANWYIGYDYLLARLDESFAQVENPYYDPYTSEVGNLVQVSFDQLVAGRVRVSVWAHSDAYNTDIPVAWLTNPGADPEKPESHFAFSDAGRNKTFYWDGTDTIGLWNALNSAEWSEVIKGAFGDKPNAVGKGYYVWNDVTTNLHTFIGDANTYSGSSPNLDPNHKPYFTIGQFAKFYIKIEVLNDALIRKDMITDRGIFSGRTVDTKRLVTLNSWNSAPMSYVWTHLGEPSHVAIRIQNYIGSGSWTPGSVVPPEDWSNPNTYDLSPTDVRGFTISEGKPVRISFQARARPGKLFNQDTARTSVKLTRNVHLKTVTFDQFLTQDGAGYKGGSDARIQRPPTGISKKSVTSRMFHNEDHTIEFEDSSYRTGDVIDQFDWIFDPTQFKKDFGNGIVESLQFGNYEQLETLPGFNPQNLGGTSAGSRASFLMAFMTYLFYFSAFTQDRSGRRQWCIRSYREAGNKIGFIDKGKIVTSSWRSKNADPTDTGNYAPHQIIDWEDKGAERYLIRSIFVREWREDYWNDPASTRSLAHSSRYNISNSFQRKFLTVPIKEFDLDDTEMTDGSTDAWLQSWNSTGTPNAGFRIGNRAMISTATDPLATRVLFLNSTARENCRPPQFGTWTFNRSQFTDYFFPSPKRDFHPYRRYPFCPDTSYLYPDFTDAGMTVLSSTGSMARETSRDAAAKSDWYGWAWSQDSGNHNLGPMLETSVEEAAADGFDKLKANSQSHILFANSFSQWNQIYDYIRSDRTDRWDQFRGVVSRGPFASRDTHPLWKISWAAIFKINVFARTASAQPVKSAGVYLLNAMRYSNYISAPPTFDARDIGADSGLKIHFTDRMYAFWDFRFHNEYVWYSDRYFPIARQGSAMYMYKGNEFTRVREVVPFPWIFPGGDQPRIYFDPGAWTGWKPDIPITGFTGSATDWTTAPYLRWREVRSNTQRPLADDLGPLNFGLTITGGETGMGTGRAEVTRSDHGQLPTTTPIDGGTVSTPFRVHRRCNILDEYHIAPTTIPRLAVGPDSPEARNIQMNLVLSETYRGT